MINEKEVIDYLNKNLQTDGQLTEITQKYIQKLKVLEKLQVAKQEELQSARIQIKKAEDSLLKINVAISVILELVAEEEGLLKSNNSNLGDS